jgi:CheY-like chemotaxis protein
VTPAKVPVLVVDDHDDDHVTAAALLARGGFAVSQAVDGRRALQHLACETEPSVVVVDLRKPLASGVELLHSMQTDRRLSRIPVIVLDERRLMPKLRGRILVAPMEKPYDAELLFALVELCAGFDLE